eukprot:gene26602-biopygen16973
MWHVGNVPLAGDPIIHPQELIGRDLGLHHLAHPVPLGSQSLQEPVDRWVGGRSRLITGDAARYQSG